MGDRDSSSSPDEERPPKKESFRSQQSLGLITQRFMSLRQKNEQMNLNDVVKELKISKRRVYDVINVLEGLGYVQKTEKNNIKWIDEDGTPAHDILEASVEQLRQQEKLVEMMLRDAEVMLRMHFEDPFSRPYSYVPKNALRMNCSPDTKSIIVKSELDTNANFEIQITEPSTSEGSYEIMVRNKAGVKSHALLLTREDPVDEEDEKPEIESPQKANRRAGPSEQDVSLSSFVDGRVKIELEDDDDEDLSKLETFVPNSKPYIPETPGRGLFLSPFRTLIDLTCILPPFGEDMTYVAPEEEPESIMDIFQ